MSTAAAFFIPLGRNLRPCPHCNAPTAETTDADGRAVVVEPSPRTALHGLGGPLVQQNKQTGQMMPEHACKQ